MWEQSVLWQASGYLSIRNYSVNLIFLFTIYQIIFFNKKFLPCLCIQKAGQCACINRRFEGSQGWVFLLKIYFWIFFINFQLMLLIYHFLFVIKIIYFTTRTINFSNRWATAHKSVSAERAISRIIFARGVFRNWRIWARCFWRCISCRSRSFRGSRYLSFISRSWNIIYDK